MGFSPNLVGLSNERITAVFLEDRPEANCRHKGLDIGSSGINKPFYAGIYGKVVPPSPDQSQWCTIAIQPFNDPTVTIQYLHASSTNVTIGDVVAPWTLLGYTGNCSPTPVPIHLHIQVLTTGVPPYSCWNGRNFINPETWDTQSALLGMWSSPDQGQNYNAVTTITIDSDSSTGKIGSIEAKVHWFWTNSTGARCEANTLYKFDLICLGMTQKNIMNVKHHNTSAIVTDSTCPFNAKLGADMDAQITLDSAYGLTLRNSAGGISLYTKGMHLNGLMNAKTELNIAKEFDKSFAKISGLDIVGEVV